MLCERCEEPRAANSTAPKSFDVVLRPGASELERFAATELQRYLKRLFGVSSSITPKPTDSADAVFVLGAATDSALRR